MAIALLSGDLAVISRVDGAARVRGQTMVSAATAERLIALLSEQEVTVVIVDLTAPAVDLQSLVPDLKQLDPAPTIVAFGPHVHEQRLAAAQDAGCDLVLSRGQFFSQLDAVLSRIVQ